MISLYALAAVFQAAAASGSGMLAPFFMKEHGFSLALVGIPLVINGVGRISSDLLSGVLANFVSSGVLLMTAAALALIASLLGMAFREVMPVFLGIWIVLGFSEAMFGLSIRKIAFDQSPPAQQGRAQGQVAAALGIGFSLGPLLGGWVGSRWGADALFMVYALPQALALVFLLLVGSHRVGRPAVAGSAAVWREGRRLFRQPSFLAACLAIFQTFLFLVGVTRVAFPFLAVNLRGLGLDVVGIIVGLSRLADTLGRFFGGRLSDVIGTRRVVLLGVLLTVPMFIFQVYGTGFLTLLIPLSFMTLGFGFTNVGGVTCALQTAGGGAKGLGLGIAKAEGLDVVGIIVGLSRLADTLGRFFGGRLSDVIGTRRVVLLGVLLTVPMFIFQVYGTGFLTLLIPLSFMTLGFGFTNVGGVTCALQTAGGGAKGLGLGIARAANSTGSMLGPLLAGVLIQQFDYEGGFFAMALISLAIFLGVWYGFSREGKKGGQSN